MLGAAAHPCAVLARLVLRLARHACNSQNVGHDHVHVSHAPCCEAELRNACCRLDRLVLQDATLLALGSERGSRKGIESTCCIRSCLCCHQRHLGEAVLRGVLASTPGSPLRSHARMRERLHASW